MNKTELTDFLAVFFPDENEPIFLRGLKAKDMPNSPENSPFVLQITRAQLKNPQLPAQLITVNLNRGIYFVVNAGGNTDIEINRFNAFFVENDMDSIEEQHSRLDCAPIPPPIRVVTEKSVHAYWLPEDECTAEEWRDMQLRLINYFNGDKSIKNPSRLMRLPFYNHLRYIPETGEIKSKLVELHTFEPLRRYTLEEMQAAFPSLPVISQLNDNGKSPRNEIKAANQAPEVSETIPHGNRHNRLLSLAGSMRRHGMNAEEIFAALKITNHLRCKPPLDEKEVWNLCRDVEARYAPECISTPESLLNSPPESINGNNLIQSKTAFCFTPLNDLLSEPEEEIAFVWENTLPVGGFSILSAKPKVGKPTLARNLALAVSRGEPFLGRETVKGKILYLCLEEKRAEVAKYLRRM